MELHEGDMILLNDGSLWVVKGCYHPRGNVVAMPRYVLGHRIKRLTDALKVIKRYYRYTLHYIPEIGITAPLIPLRHIVKTLKAFKNKCHKNRSEGILRVCNELISVIESSCSTVCGVTGSILGGYWGSNSDIDVVCSDKPNIYDCLLRLRREGVLKPITQKHFEVELSSVDEGLRRDTHIELVRLKVLQGSFMNYRYTLRIINCSRSTNILGPYDYVTQSPSVIAYILDSDYRTPSIIKLNIIKAVMNEYISFRSNNLALGLTHRIRYTELPRGSIMYVSNARLLIKSGTPIINLDFSKYVNILLPLNVSLG